MAEDIIYYYMREPAITVLGPGIRYGLWVQGCNKHCPGCVAPDTHNMEDGSKIKIGALAFEIAHSGAEGLTISGGEPFLQASALTRLIDRVHERRPDMGVIVYSGYTYEELLQREDAKALLNRIDVLIDGEYVRDRNDGKGIRGSSNQRIISLTDRYRELTSEMESQTRKWEVFHRGYEVHVAGIPNRNGKYR